MMVHKREWGGGIGWVVGHSRDGGMKEIVGYRVSDGA